MGIKIVSNENFDQVSISNMTIRRFCEILFVPGLVFNSFRLDIDSASETKIIESRKLIK